MFFQSIYQMIASGTDLNINIRRVEDKLTVAVMPRRTNLKDEAQQLMVPLILNGTPAELDAEFLQAVVTPLQKTQGILTNLETFEKQADQAAAQSKAAKSATEKESKEVREKQEKMEKLLQKADEAATARKYSEAAIWLKQARALATPDKQKEIDSKMQEVQKKVSEGSLFAEPAQQAQPVPQQPIGNNIPNRQQGVAGEQMQMFGAQPQPQAVSQPAPQPIHQPAPRQQTQSALQPMPQPQIMQSQPASQTYQPEMLQPQPMYGQYYPNPANNIPGQQPIGQPQIYAGQPQQQYVGQPQFVGQPQQPQQWQQPQSMPQQPQAPVMQAASGNAGREYHSQPQAVEPLSFDNDDESDRERLREDPYSEYLDFPEEYRMKDEAQMELVCI